MTASDLSAPIGIFDSGFGGLTVARAIADLLPCENLLYLGDTLRAPYGSQSIAQVRHNTLQCLDYLKDHNVKALVIACNTGSAAALHDARERYDIPVIEVIVPAARKAAAITRNRQIGVICTQATARSSSYEDALAACDVTVTTQVCDRFVPFVEAGITAGDEVMEAARCYLAPMMEAQVDTLILGCTHYPLLSGVISYLMGPSVTLVSSADEGARETFAILTDQGLLNPSTTRGEHHFYTTGNASIFENLGQRLIADLVENVRHITLETSSH